MCRYSFIKLDAVTSRFYYKTPPAVSILTIYCALKLVQGVIYIIYSADMSFPLIKELARIKLVWDCMRSSIEVIKAPIGGQVATFGQ